MVELVDTQDLGSCAFGRAGSSPVTRTQFFPEIAGVFFGDSGFIFPNLLLNDLYTRDLRCTFERTQIGHVSETGIFHHRDRLT